MSRFSVAKNKVLQDLEGIIEDLWQGKRKYRRTGTWNVVNRFRPKADEGQTVVWLKGARRGAWKDFVSGDAGDAIDLVAFGLTGSKDAEARMKAIAWIEDRYGIRNMDPAELERVNREANSRRQAAAAADERRRKASIDRARKFFFSCQPIAGSLAEVYLRSRGVDLAAVPHLGRALRFHPSCEYWMRDDKPRFPAMVAAMVDAGGHLAACHYTFLKADGSDKVGAPEGVEKGKAKLMFPETSGLVIRLTDGASGLPAEKAVEQGTLGPVGIVEGIEDGLSVARANAELRMWSAGSLGGFASVPDHAAVSGWLIFQDNDWGKPQAQEQFRRAVARVKSFGKPVVTLAMPAAWGKDVNDAIRGGWQ